MTITGAHVVLYSKDAEADRRFFRDVLKLRHVDAGDGWLIFALPPTEAAFHPVKTRGRPSHELYLTCDDLEETLDSLRRRKVKCRILGEQSWGNVAVITLPSGAELGVYEPKHKTTIG